MKDYYAMLGLNRKASASQIETAVERLLEYYPVGSAEGERVLMARDVLLDPRLRRRYDREQEHLAGSPAPHPAAGAMLGILSWPVRPIHWFAREWVRNFIRLLKIAKGQWLGNFLKQLFWMEIFILCTGNQQTLNAVDIGLIALVSMNWTIYADIPEFLLKYHVGNPGMMPDSTACTLSSLLVLGLCCSIAFANYHYPAFYLSAPEMYLLWVQMLIFLKKRKIARMERLEQFTWNSGSRQ